MNLSLYIIEVIFIQYNIYKHSYIAIIIITIITANNAILIVIVTIITTADFLLYITQISKSVIMFRIVYLYIFNPKKKKRFSSWYFNQHTQK